MPLLLLLLFIGIPIAEIALFIEIGERIGLGWTLFSILATALAGTWLVRQQGMQTMARAREAMAQNRMPVDEVIAGVCILLAGALLLTPGFLTDALGFVLLIPPLRKGLAAGVVGRMKTSGRFHMHAQGAGFGAQAGGMGASPNTGRSGQGPSGQGPIIDGEYEDVTGDPDPNSPWHKGGGTASPTHSSLPNNGSGETKS